MGSIQPGEKNHTHVAFSMGKNARIIVGFLGLGMGPATGIVTGSSGLLAPTNENKGLADYRLTPFSRASPLRHPFGAKIDGFSHGWSRGLHGRELIAFIDFYLKLIPCFIKFTIRITPAASPFSKSA